MTNTNKSGISTASTTNAACNGSSGGSIDINVSYAPFPTYCWSNGATTQDIANLSFGTYSVLVTDNAGHCATYEENVGSSGTPPSISSTTATPSSCNMVDGTIEIIVSGSGPYTYSYTQLNGTSSGTFEMPVPALSALPAHIQASVVLKNSCSFCPNNNNKTDVSFDIRPKPDATSVLETATILQGCTVNLDVTIPGTSNIIYQWTPATGLNTLTGPTVEASPTISTTYTVYINDLNEVGGIYGCCDTIQVPVTVLPVTLSNPPTYIACYTPGNYTFSVSSGLNSYQWKLNGSNISGATNYNLLLSYLLATGGPPYFVPYAGTYSVDVTDATGCSVMIDPAGTLVQPTFTGGISQCRYEDEETKQLIPSSSNVLIIPNPNNGSFIVSAPDFKGEEVVVEVYNAFAKKVYEMKYSNFTGLSYNQMPDALSEGFYIVRVRSNAKSETAKMMLHEDH